MKLTIDKKTLAKTVSKIGRMRDMKMVARAHLSALKSCGWLIRDQLRRYIEYGGQGWEPLHPLTKEFRRTKIGWAPREWKATPLYWLGRFARYVVAADASVAAVGFGKSRKGRPDRAPRPGSFDPRIDELVRKHEVGRTYPVTEAVRRKWAATGKYSLRSRTGAITIPARPSISTVSMMMLPKIPRFFQQRFEKAMRRYLSGVNNKSSGSTRTKLL